MKRMHAWITLATLTLLLAACGSQQAFEVDADATVALAELPLSVTWSGQGSDSLQCEKLGESPERTSDGWIHWIVTFAFDVTDAQLVLSGSGSGAYPTTKYGPVLEFFTPYFDIDTLQATLHHAGALGANTQFVISDYCPGETDEGDVLRVSKSAYTSFHRGHDWDLDKMVDATHVSLSADDTKTVEWTIDVEYLGSTDSAFTIFGSIEIENVSASSARTVGPVLDDVGVNGVDPFEVACTLNDAAVTLPYDLGPGQTLVCGYSIDVTGSVSDGDSGMNTATVSVDGEDDLTATAQWAFDGPTSEVNGTVYLWDYSDLVGHWVFLGQFDAPAGGSLNYDYTFAWGDFKCKDRNIGNWAKLFLDRQPATFDRAAAFANANAWVSVTFDGCGVSQPVEHDDHDKENREPPKDEYGYEYKYDLQEDDEEPVAA